MYCSNCGKEWKAGDVFCGGCGKAKDQDQSSNIAEEVQPIVQSLQQPVVKKKGLPVWAIVLIVFGAIGLVAVLGVILFGFVIFNTISETETYIYEQTEDYVYYEGEEIPSVYYFFGEYEMCSPPAYQYSEGHEVLNYTYCDDSFDEDTINKYLDSLVLDFGFDVYENTSMVRSVRKQSKEKGYYLVVRAYIYGENIEYYKEEEKIYTEDNSI